MGLTRRKQQRKTIKIKGGASAALVPSAFCSVSPEPLPAEPVKPLLNDNAPFPKPWLNVDSNILFTALVIAENSTLGMKIKELSALAGQNPYSGDLSAVLERPHISIMNIYLPAILKKSIHAYAMSSLGLAMVSNIIAGVVKKHIINTNNVLTAENNSYTQFGKFVVKKYKDESGQFIENVYKPFKEDIVSSLSQLISSDKRAIIKCFPAYFPHGKVMHTFTHYSTDKSNKSSDFAISKYFEEDLSPHISLIKSDDPRERNNFIEEIQALNTSDMNQVELSSKDISSIFVSYMGKWTSLDL